MKKSEYIIQAVLSLNAGNSGYTTPPSYRVDVATGQADLLEKLGVFENEKEQEDKDERFWKNE